MKKVIFIFVLAAFAACNGASNSKAPVVDSTKTDTVKKTVVDSSKLSK